MDFSKLSDTDLVALKNGKYGSLSDEGLKELKTQTSATNPVTQKQDWMNEPGLQNANFIIPEKAPAQGLGALGDLMAGKGLQQASNVATGQAAPASMAGKVGNFVGGAVSPTNIALAGMAGGVGQAAAAGDLGMAGRVVAGPSRSAAGEAIGSAEQAAGVHPDIIPTIKDVTANLGLKNANAKQYLNALMERLKSGEEMSAEALSQHHKMITDLLSNEPSGIAKTVMGAASKLGSTAVAQASKADKMIVNLLNEQAPGRAEGAANYAAAKIRGTIGKYALGAAAGYAGKNVIMDAFNRLAGGR